MYRCHVKDGITTYLTAIFPTAPLVWLQLSAYVFLALQAPFRTAASHVHLLAFKTFCRTNMKPVLGTGACLKRSIKNPHFRDAEYQLQKKSARTLLARNCRLCTVHLKMNFSANVDDWLSLSSRIKKWFFHIVHKLGLNKTNPHCSPNPTYAVLPTSYGQLTHWHLRSVFGIRVAVPEIISS